MPRSEALDSMADGFRLLLRAVCRRCSSNARVLVLVILVCLVSCCLLATGAAQSLDTAALEAYLSAIKRPVITERAAAMERFLSIAGNSGLKLDALEVLTWDYLRTGDRAKSLSRARDLLAIDPMNPAALAIVSDGDSPAREEIANQFSLSRRGLQQIPQMRKPEAMSQGEFKLMQACLSAMLHGAAGLGYIGNRNYRAARDHLQQAVAAEPENGRYLYGLALSLLLDKDPDVAGGYWYLAKAVSLTQGTPAGEQISAYARTRYQEDGGISRDWNQFIIAATHAKAPGRVMMTADSTKASGTIQLPSARPPVSALTIPKDVKSNSAAPQIAFATKPGSVSAAKSTLKSSHLVAPEAPVSLGILIQTALFSPQNRKVITGALSDIVRHLRPRDEAFIMVFSNELDFEQDLTDNPALLEEGLKGIHPKSGAALFDGIAFATGHLKRIGRNKKRVLLLISDGHNTSSETDAAPLSAHLNEVRIDCIGLNAEGPAERQLLERLASYSGGEASFPVSIQQFRTATLRMAENIGITIPN
jgi:tetratricopeptide (TPR) repeat protein